jgi:hypothetical protein
LAQELRTRADVLAKLGQPDEEIPNGSSQIAPAIFWSAPDFSTKDGQSSRMMSFDVMRYYNLSPTAIVDFIVRPDDRVSFSHALKRADVQG